MRGNPLNALEWSSLDVRRLRGNRILEIKH
jgi:hypothetical protein